MVYPSHFPAPPAIHSKQYNPEQPKRSTVLLSRSLYSPSDVTLPDTCQPLSLVPGASLSWSSQPFRELCGVRCISVPREPHPRQAHLSDWRFPKVFSATNAMPKNRRTILKWAASFEKQTAPQVQQKHAVQSCAQRSLPFLIYFSSRRGSGMEVLKKRRASRKNREPFEASVNLAAQFPTRLRVFFPRWANERRAYGGAVLSKRTNNLKFCIYVLFGCC